jgi:pimeloyl-ACP methyl ester carboxylesterase
VIPGLRRGALALVAAATVAAGAAGASSGGGPALSDSHACAEAAGYTCSSLVVPLDRRGRRSGSLKLAVGAADNVDAPRGVLLLIAGGPGQAGLPLLMRLPAIVGAELTEYRVVVYDQRGTGRGALRCNALQDAMGSSDLYPPPAAAVRSCAAHLGPRRQYFGTDDVIADMESLRQALGVEAWALDGISYGSFVGARYALAHPGRVTKLVLDSVVPHTGRADLGVDAFAATRRILGGVCGAACVGDLAAVVRAKHLGVELLDALTLLSIIDPSFEKTIDVPELLRAARLGNARGLRDFLDLVHDRWEATPAAVLDQGLHASALCADWRFPWGSSAAPSAGRTAKLARAVARIPVEDIYPFDRATAAGNGFVRQCLPWAPTPPTLLSTGKLTVPTLLVNGDRDLSTPLEWAREELKRTTDARLVVVHGAGHSIQARARSDAGREAIARFLLG